MGTLSEEEVHFDQSRGEIIRTLNRRGILNSVCSKNDWSHARAQLETIGLWGQIVFPSIDWTAKGHRIAGILEDMQLQPHHALFIDDLLANREEARYAAPGIQTAGPEIVDSLLTLGALEGGDDADLSRLHRYRLLERKRTDRKASSETSEEFLRSCDIRVSIVPATEAEFPRLFELLHRTNQLNFTKRRPTEHEFHSLLNDPQRQSAYVQVRDRYGDYGICGFYSLSESGSTLDDFLFSCRVLNMGVEQWVYRQLGRPRLSVVGEVASNVLDDCDWINADPAGPTGAQIGRPPRPADQLDQSARVLMVGGCDPETVALFLGGAIETDFHRNGETGALIHPEHTDILQQAAAGLSDPQRQVLERLPFLDERAFAPPTLHSEYEVLVYSLLMDYTQDRYRHRSTGLVVPWNQLDVNALEPSNWDELDRKFGRWGVDEQFLLWFSGEFERMGALSSEELRDHVRWLARTVAPGCQIIFLNGAEVEIDGSVEPKRYLRHREMNAALDDEVRGLSNAAICDVRKFVGGIDDLARASTSATTVGTSTGRSPRRFEPWCR